MKAQIKGHRLILHREGPNDTLFTAVVIQAVTGENIQRHETAWILRQAMNHGVLDFYRLTAHLEIAEILIEAVDNTGPLDEDDAEELSQVSEVLETWVRRYA